MSGVRIAASGDTFAEVLRGCCPARTGPRPRRVVARRPGCPSLGDAAKQPRGRRDEHRVNTPGNLRRTSDADWHPGRGGWGETIRIRRPDRGPNGCGQTRRHARERCRPKSARKAPSRTSHPLRPDVGEHNLHYQTVRSPACRSTARRRDLRQPLVTGRGFRAATVRFCRRVHRLLMRSGWCTPAAAPLPWTAGSRARREAGRITIPASRQQRQSPLLRLSVAARGRDAIARCAESSPGRLVSGQ